MERLIKIFTTEISEGRYQISESGCVITDYGWIYEDMSHDFIIKTKRGDMRRKLAKSSDLVKLFRKVMGG